METLIWSLGTTDSSCSSNREARLEPIELQLTKCSTYISTASTNVPITSKTFIIKEEETYMCASRLNIGDIAMILMSLSSAGLGIAAEAPEDLPKT